MFLTNWLILQIVAAGVTGAVEYPSAADFFMNFDSNNRLYFTGGSKDYVSNLILYKGETEYPVYNGSVSNIYISDPASYVSYIQLCGETYVTNTVDVQAVVNPEGTFPDTATNTIYGFESAIVHGPSQGGFGGYIDFNGDGTRMVLGASVDFSSAQGRAYVYHLEDGSWVQKVDIPSPNTSYQRFGDSVLMNEDGTRIAVNHYDFSKIHIYEYTNGAWPTTPTTSISTSNYSGKGDMDWNNDGTVIVAGDGNESNSGKTYVYRLNGGTWTETNIGSAGHGVAINGAGTRILAGVRRASGSNPNYTGKMYESNYDSGTSTWSSLTEVASVYPTTGWPTKIRMDNNGTTAIILTAGGDNSGIYERQSGSSWTESSSVEGYVSFYGMGTGSISYDGTMVLTGYYTYTDSVSGQGRAYLYEYTNGSWSLTKTFENPKTTPVANDYWGYGTAITKLKDRIAIGMTGDDTAGTNYGSLYVYDLEYSYPTLTQDNYNKLTLNSLTDVQRSRLTLNSNTYTANGPVSKFFVNEAGTYEVSATGSNAYAIVKKTVSAPVTLTEADIAFIDYTQMDTTEQKIVASDTTSQDYFGLYVGISGDYAIVSASGEDGGATNAGAAYIFYKSGGTWTQQAKLIPSDIAAGDDISHVAISGDYALFGAYRKNSYTGAAYIFKRSGTTWTQHAKLTASDGQAQDEYGHAVSIDGDYAVVGAWFEDTGGNNAGAAYIYKRDPISDTWSQQQKIQASDKAAGDHFSGYSVSISGDYVIVGAPFEDTGGSNAGAAYIFKRDGTSWSEQQKIQASDIQQGDQFGWSVSLSGDYAIVGAVYEDAGGTSTTGAAYIFKRDGTTWSQQQKIISSDIQAQDQFGQSVSISGDYAIVGAFSEDTGGTDAGAAYLFKRDGTTWSEIKKLTANDAQAGDRFGQSIAFDGTHVIVGAHQETAGGASAGAAYIYKAPVIPSPKLTYDTYNKLTLSNVFTSYSSTLRYESNTYDIGTASTIIIQDPGRYEIATTDNTNFLSLNSNVTGQTVTQVAVYDYTQMDTTEQKITASDKQQNDQFGYSVSLSGDYAIVGAPYEDTGATNAGAAYIYTRIPSTGVWGSEQKILASDIEQDDRFGYSVSLSGDYAIVGAPYEDTGGAAAGAAYIYKRDPSTGVWGSEQKIQASDIQQGDEFGVSVSISGDYAIVGAYFEDTGGDRIGAAYIYKRDASTGVWGSEQKIQASDKQAVDFFGQYVSISGDYAIVSALNDDVGSSDTNHGAAYIYSKLNAITSYTVRITSTQLGTSSTGTGNFDITPSDGAVTLRNWGDSPSSDDLGAPLWDNASGTSLQVYADGTIILAGETLTTYIVGGSPATWYECGSNLGGTLYHVAITIVSRTTSDSEFVWGSEQKIQASDIQAADYYGRSVSISGAGYAIVGVPDKDAYTGAVYIYTRNPSTGTWGSEQKIQASDKQQGDEFGYSVSISGDYAIVGARLEDDTGGTEAGAAYIFKRDGTTWSEIKKIQASDTQQNDRFGYSVAIDGPYAIVGARLEDAGATDAGAAYIYEAPNLASTLAYDGLNTLVLSNVSTGSYNTFLEGSNVLACATDLTTYPVPRSGITGTFTYSARTKSDSVYAFTNDVSITDYYKTYQYPPIDGTTTGLTTSTTADTWNTWTISGAANGNGTYKAKWSVATGDGTPYNTFRNNVGSTNQVQTALNPTYPIDITLELPSAKTIRKYRMFPLDHNNPYGPGTDATSGTSVDPTLSGNGGDDATKRPKSWVLKGSNDDANWTDLDTVTNKPISIYGDVYSIDSPASYQYYKLSVTANNGGNKLLFGDIQLWGDT